MYVNWICLASIHLLCSHDDRILKLSFDRVVISTFEFMFRAWQIKFVALKVYADYKTEGETRYARFVRKKKT